MCPEFCCESRALSWFSQPSRDKVCDKARHRRDKAQSCSAHHLPIQSLTNPDPPKCSIYKAFAPKDLHGKTNRSNPYLGNNAVYRARLFRQKLGTARFFPLDSCRTVLAESPRGIPAGD